MACNLFCNKLTATSSGFELHLSFYSMVKRLQYSFLSICPLQSVVVSLLLFALNLHSAQIQSQYDPLAHSDVQLALKGHYVDLEKKLKLRIFIFIILMR